MNDKSRTDADQQVGGEATEDASFGDDLGDIAVEKPSVPGRSRSALIATGIATLLSLVALVVSGLLLLRDAGDAEQLATTDYVDRVAADLRAVDPALRDLQRRIDELAASQGATARERADADRQLEQRLAALEGVEGRVASLESSFAALRGISTGVRDAWLLAEAEYYMQIANAQLQLASNPELAESALELADGTLRAISDPGLIDVRRALADELQRLEAVERPDIEGATLTLASLATVVGGLPLKPELSSAAAGSGDTGPGPELEGTDRAIASLKDALGGLVTVRRSDETIRPLMAPEAAYFLRANLALQLQAARLGLLRGEQTIFRQSLDDALAWLREYYDVESAPVKSAILTITEIRNSAFTAALPDISGSLRLLREYSAFRSATERGAGDTDTGQPQ